MLTNIFQDYNIKISGEKYKTTPFSINESARIKIVVKSQAIEYIKNLKFQLSQVHNFLQTCQ